MWPLGLHTIPHMFVLGTQADVPASPSDPWFFFHHAALDRAALLWLYIDFDARVTTLPQADAYNDMRTLFQCKSPIPKKKSSHGGYTRLLTDCSQRRQRPPWAWTTRSSFLPFLKESEWETSWIRPTEDIAIDMIEHQYSSNFKSVFLLPNSTE